MALRTFIDQHRAAIGFGLVAVALGSTGLWLAGRQRTERPLPAPLDAAALEALQAMRTENDALVAQLDEIKGQLIEATAVSSQPVSSEGSVAGVSDPPRSPSGTKTVPTGRLNLNTATQAQLEDLPGIGPSKATAILDYRADHGPFHDPHDLVNVKGIGEKTYDGLKDHVTVK